MNTPTLTIPEAFENLSLNYADVLTHGGNPERYFRAIRLAKAIAKVMSVDVQIVIDAVQEN